MDYLDRQDGSEHSSEDIKAAIEAVLFTAGEPLSLDILTAVTGMDRKETKDLIEVMASEFADRSHGILIREIEGGYQLCTKPECYKYIESLVEQRHKQPLSQAALEVLSVVAYRQPVTKAVVESIRGVSSDSSFDRLIEKNLIAEIGRLDAPGKPKLYSTTEEFLRQFGLKSAEELPVMNLPVQEPVYPGGKDGDETEDTKSDPAPGDMDLVDPGTAAPGTGDPGIEKGDLQE